MITTYVLGFIFDEARDHVLLIHKNRPAWQRGRLNGIGGKVKPGEGFLEAIRRECEEASNLSGLDWQHVATLTGEEYYVAVFAAFTQAVFHAIQKTDEVLQVFPHRSLPERRIMSNLPVLIALALDESGITKPVILEEVGASNAGNANPGAVA
jgi:8-oxo-dGTP diphosphatase